MSKKTLEIQDCLVENVTVGAVLQSKLIKVFLSMIKALNYIETLDIQLSNVGMKYIVEESKSFQTIAYIKRDFFSKYRMRDVETVSFGVNLTDLADIMSTLMDHDMAEMKIVYYHLKNCILFTIEQNVSPENFNVTFLDNDENQHGEKKTTTEFFLKTMESFDPIDFDKVSTVRVSSIIMNYEEFQDALFEMEGNADEMEIQVDSDRLIFRGVEEIDVETKTEFPNNEELFSKFECEEPSKFLYKFTYFQVILKALSLASKVSLQTYSDGLLRVQLMIRSEEEQASSAFIEYNMVASVIDEPDLDETR